MRKRKSNYTGHNNGRNKFTLEQELEISKIDNLFRSEIAKKLNCCKTTIRDILLRYNIKLKRG